MSTPEIGLYPDATPDEQIAYSMGWNTATAIARTEAFAAIRRAVEFARSCNQFATELDDDQRPDTWLVPCQLWCAETIRNAIRAAIGSEKAS